MGYTDLTQEWDYKDLLTWQSLDSAAENDALFQKRFTGDESPDGLIPGPLRISNNVFVKWRNAAGSADIDGIKLNASDQLELGTVLKTPTLTADPVADMEASTKRYVDGETMRMGLVPRVRITLSRTALGDTGWVETFGYSGAGRVNTVNWWRRTPSIHTGATFWLRIVVDGVLLYEGSIYQWGSVATESEIVKAPANSIGNFVLHDAVLTPEGRSDLFYFKSSVKFFQRIVVGYSPGECTMTLTIDYERI